jgi:gamma-glutamyltranspeptidase/glutathione hydrolase
MAAVDREGNMVSLTQTVLNAFGARVLDPRTGVLLNNGIGYFDPRPGSPHSVRPGALAFSAMTPLILCDDGGPVAAVGASGGRRIISGVAQIVAALAAGGVSLQDACEGPWIHTESDAALLDVRWPAGTAESLEEAGFTVEPAEDTPTVGNFARPGGVMIGPDGRRRSGLDPTKPGGAAAV